MEIKEVTGKHIKDVYYKVSHPAGLKIFVYPRKNSSSTYAIFGTEYGSVDNCFKRSDEAAAERVPEGIAHYLEHKLFESEQGDAFERFAKTGASANAFTSFESTCYLFSAADNVYESLEILLDFVQSPYFTEETVAKEQGIIGQEIKMYDDDPQWRVMFNLLRAIYHKHPIKEDIAGTVESIAKITPEYLYRCYDTFYNLHNMALCVVGNVELEKVIEICNRMLKPSEPISVDRIFEDESDTVAEKYIEEQLSVAVPMFLLGYKEKVDGGHRTEKDIAAMEVLLDIMISDASPLFRKLLDKGLINEASFSHEYFEGAGYACVFFGGESADPKGAAEEIRTEIKEIKENGISQEAFERSKRAVYGEIVKALNSSSVIANAIMNRTFKNREMLKELDVYTELTLEDVQNKLNDVLDEEKSALSVISPL